MCPVPPGCFDSDAQIEAAIEELTVTMGVGNFCSLDVAEVIERRTKEAWRLWYELP